MRKLALALGASSLCLAGCGANYTTVFHQTTLQKVPLAKDGTPKATIGKPAKKLVTIDAKQRAVVATEHGVCTEPPPDVFSALAQSVTAKGSASVGADSKVDVGGAFGFTSAEQAATIARTQTHNLLALMAYYNCLSTLNAGDDSKDELQFDRIRMERMMIRALAIEQSTGALRAPTVVLGASSSQSSAADAVKALADGYKAWQDAEDDATAKKAPVASAQEAADKAKADLGTTTCTDASTDEKCVASKKAQAALKTAKETLANAEAKRTTAKGQYDTLKKAVDSGVVALSATVQEAKVKATDQWASPAQSIANAVAEIVRDTSHDDEVQLFCMRELPKVKDDDIKSACIAYLSAKINVDAIAFNEEYQRAVQRIKVYADNKLETLTADRKKTLQALNDIIDKADTTSTAKNQYLILKGLMSVRGQLDTKAISAWISDTDTDYVKALMKTLRDDK